MNRATLPELLSEIHFPSVPYSYYQDPRSAVPDFKQDAVIANAKTVAFGAFEFLCPGRAWVVGQGMDMGRKAGRDIFREFSELAGCPGSEINTVRHGGSTLATQSWI